MINLVLLETMKTAVVLIENNNICKAQSGTAVLCEMQDLQPEATSLDSYYMKVSNVRTLILSQNIDKNNV